VRRGAINSPAIRHIRVWIPSWTNSTLAVVEFMDYRYRLYPTPAQSETLARWAGCARTIYNAGVEQRRAAWHLKRVSLSYSDQAGAQLTEAKRAFRWLREPHADVLQQALKDLDTAYTRFLTGLSAYPKRRRKGRSDRFRIQSRSPYGEIKVRRVSRKWGEVRVPKLGWIRFRWSRRPAGTIRHMTVTRDPLGWHVSICCLVEAMAGTKPSAECVGLDLGVRATVATSAGQLHRCPSLSAGQVERLRRLTRKAGRQETLRRRRAPGNRRRSRRHQRTLDQIAHLRAREARLRLDFHHKLSTDLAKNHGVVAVEKLDIRRLTRSARGTAQRPGVRVAAKAGLNRAILAQGWGHLLRQLAYKLNRYGGRLVEVPPAYTSQRCAACGAVARESRQTQARFVCVNCGHEVDADVNAALNVLAAGLAVTARGDLGGGPVVEARTNPEGAAHAA
jgi:putative transposase